MPERSMNDFSWAFRSFQVTIFCFCSRLEYGRNPPFFEDSSPMKRLEPLSHIEMRAFLRAFAKTTSSMWLLYISIYYLVRVLFWHHYWLWRRPETSSNRLALQHFLIENRQAPSSETRLRAPAAATKCGSYLCSRIDRALLGKRRC